MPPTIAGLTSKSREHTLMWPPSYSYGYRQSMMTNSLMRLANLPFKTDAICGQKAQENQPGLPGTARCKYPMGGRIQKDDLQFLERCILNPDASQQLYERDSPGGGGKKRYLVNLKRPINATLTLLACLVRGSFIHKP